MSGGTSLPSKELRLNYGRVDRKTGKVSVGGGHIGGGHPGNAQIPGHATGWNTTAHGQLSGDFGNSRLAGGSFRDLCPRLFSPGYCNGGGGQRGKPSWIESSYMQLMPADKFCLTNPCTNPMQFKIEPAVYGRMPTFSWLELYIMGLVTPDKVPHYYSTGGKLDFTDLDHITAEKVGTVTMQDWIKVHGVRNPPAGQDQKHFQLGVMVLSDRPFSEAEYAYWSLIYWRFGTTDPRIKYDGFGPPPWHAATRRLSTITSHLP